MQDTASGQTQCFTPRPSGPRLEDEEAVALASWLRMRWGPTLRLTVPCFNISKSGINMMVEIFLFATVPLSHARVVPASNTPIAAIVSECHDHGLVRVGGSEVYSPVP